MPTFAEWERRRGAVAPQGAPVPTQDEDLTPGPLGPMRHATGGDDYLSAAEGELLRTGKEAALGMLRGVPDTVSNLYNTVRHPLDTLMGLGHTIAHPVETVENLAKSPRDAGSLLTQMLLASKLPGAANTALAEGPAMAGRGISAVGRGAEALGTSRVLKSANKFGVLGTAMSGHPGLAALELAAPPALEYGGRGLQKLGGALEGLDLSVKENPFTRMNAAEELVDPAADTVRETVRTAREAQAGGASRKQAASRAGWPLGKSTEVPSYPDEPLNTELFPYQKDALEAARQAKGDSAWANDASAQPEAKSPIEQFYDSDPQARIGGEGRMTGQFEEGEGGLKSIGSPLDDLAQLSGRQVSPARMQELLKKFDGAGA